MNQTIIITSILVFLSLTSFSSKAEVNTSKNPKQKGEPIHVVKNDWQAQWITDNRGIEYEPAPLFRKNIKISGKRIVQAQVYVSVTGYYEMFINGKRVGNDYLDPGYTNFSKRILYSVHDVSGLLKDGQKYRICGTGERLV